ncbi:MAG: hypothetical protein WCF09_11280 [Gallionella sp.]
MMKSKLASLVVAALLLQGFAVWAGENEAENLKPALQIVNQTGLKVVVQVNSGDTTPGGISKRATAVRVFTIFTRHSG